MGPWKENPSPHPTSVEVQLQRDGEAVGNPISLSAADAWTHTWRNLDTENVWTVMEVNVPATYSPSSVTNGTQITITNTYTPIAAQPEGPGVPPENEPVRPEEPPVSPDEPKAPPQDEPSLPPEFEVATTPEAELPQTGDIPQTGDESRLWLYFLLLSLSSMAGIVLLKPATKQRNY